MYTFCDWIDIKKLNKHLLMFNPNKALLYDNYSEFINWQIMSYDENAISILLKNPDLIQWLARVR